MGSMRIVLAGGSGFLGTALARHWRAADHEVLQLVRGAADRPDERSWDPSAGVLDAAHLAGADVVVNIGGAPIVRWPWTRGWRELILNSRLETTGTVARTVAALDDRPALVNASGVNYYGADRGVEQLDEESTSGDGFLADVCRQWEAATQPAADAGSRVAILRTSPVLHRSGGVLKLAKLPFQVGLGGRLGSGEQFFASISLDDYLAAVTRIVTDDNLDGPFNLAAPLAATNRELTRALGRRLNRPTAVPAPAFALRAVAGEQSSLLLGSLNVAPRRLIDAGFEFAHPTIEEQVDAAFA
jgi:uncharacterized protein (TIGR01777 family)